MADSSVDVVISNSVINLSADKLRAFQEAFRALKPGGRLMVSDLVLLGEPPDGIKNSIEAYVGCVAGALPEVQYLNTIGQAGFYGVEACDEAALPAELAGSDPAAQKIVEKTGITAQELKDVLGLVVSVKAKGTNPQ